MQKNRIDKLLKSGFIQETEFGEVVITVRGQLELARWRFRHLPKKKVVFSGPVPREAFLGKLLKASWKTT